MQRERRVVGVGDRLDDREPEAQPGVAVAGPALESLERLDEYGHPIRCDHRAAVRHLELGVAAEWPVRTSICPPGPLCRTALSIRLPTSRSSSALSPTAVASPVAR